MEVDQMHVGPAARMVRYGLARRARNRVIYLPEGPPIRHLITDIKADGLTMLNSQRIFVDAVTGYCAKRAIAVDVRADGWLIVMQRGARQRFAFGYDVGLNSAVAHRIANDKSAAAEVLSISGIACVPHALFLSPEMNQYIRARGSWEAMLGLLSENPQGIVVKPNEGTSGKSVFRVTSKPALELAVKRIFSSHMGLAISPYLDIEDEVRVVLIDAAPLVVYSKSRPAVEGDGRHSLLELALEATSAGRRSTVLAGMMAELDKAELDEVPPPGQRRVLNWRHNLDSGALPILLEHGERRDACVQLAAKAAQAIDIRFASIDVVRVQGEWRVLEINSGVMMEALSKLHPELVYAAYAAALDKVFET
jgi:glutathione synthase/RimK-type ligase-like ATP-grasp enzyme